MRMVRIHEHVQSVWYILCSESLHDPSGSKEIAPCSSELLQVLGIKESKPAGNK